MLYHAVMESCPAAVGDRIVVCGYIEYDCKVSATTWVPEEARWKITVDWGALGESHVWSTDRDKTWYLLKVVNL